MTEYETHELDARIFAASKTLAEMRLRLARDLFLLARALVKDAREAMVMAEAAARRLSKHANPIDEFDREMARILERLEDRS